MEVPKIDKSRPAPICAPKRKVYSKYRKILPLPPNARKTRWDHDAYTKKICNKRSVVIKKTRKRRKLKDNIDKRKERNSLERKRRVKINKLIGRLKELIPNIQEKRKASKITILKEAHNLLKELHVIEKYFELRDRLSEMEFYSNLRVHSF